MKNLGFAILLFFPVFVNAQRTAIKFNSEQDSMRYYQIDEEINVLFQESTMNDTSKVKTYDMSGGRKAKLDSLMKEKFAIANIKYNRYDPGKDDVVYHKNISRDSLKYLRSIQFHEYKKKRIPLKLLRAKNLNELVLTSSQIKKIPFWLTWRNDIHTIKIYNHVYEKGIKFGKNTKTKKLVYRENVHANAPRNIHQLKKVTEIDFVNNDVQNPEWKLHKIKWLKELNVSRNNMPLSKLSEKPVPQLENLILGFNQLDSLTHDILLFPNLRELQLAENRIRWITPQIKHLERLETLVLYKNQLKNLPEEIYTLKNMVELDIYFNSIRRISSKIGQMQKLERLYLAENELIALPDEIGFLNNLRKLYIHHNKLTFLPESFARLTKITHFHINNNHFSYLPPEVLQMKELEDLDISHNDISELPYELLELQKLRLLWLHDNPMFVTEHTKSSAENLKNVIEGFLELGVKVQIE